MDDALLKMKPKHNRCGSRHFVLGKSFRIYPTRLITRPPKLSIMMSHTTNIEEAGFMTYTAARSSRPSLFTVMK